MTPQARGKIQWLWNVLTILGIGCFVAFLTSASNGGFETRHQVSKVEVFGPERLLVTIQVKHGWITEYFATSETRDYVVSLKSHTVWLKTGSGDTLAITPFKDNTLAVEAMGMEYLERQQVLQSFKERTEPESVPEEVVPEETQTQPTTDD